MRSSKPPALATWLLEHVAPGEKNAALTGDLLEQFGQGRSAGWYWRQVVAAILTGVYKEQRIFWIAAGVTAVWMRFLFVFWVHLGLRDMFGILMGGIRIPWPWSMIYFVACYAILFALPILFALALHVVVTRTFSPPKFLLGLLVGLLTVAVGYVIEVELGPVSRHFYGVASLPLFLALLFAM